MTSRDNNSVSVLHVDDEPEFARLTAEMLEKIEDQFSIAVATSASEGITHLRTEEVDCVVSDYDMPGQDGIEFLKTIREEHPQLPFILFTGKGSESVASDAIAAETTDYLQKEPRTEQFELLANRILNAVDRYRAEQKAVETERRLHELSEVTNECLWICSADWTDLLFVNSAYEDIWGRSTEQLRASPRDFLNGVHPQDRDRVEEAMQRLSDGEPVDLEFRVNATQNYERRVWVQGHPIFDESGDVLRVAGFTRDLTALRQDRKNPV